MGVPPKLCHFIWRGCRNILVVHTNLRRRVIQLENSCPLSDEDVETQVHLFFHCPFAGVFWFGSLLQLDVMKVEGGDFLECWKWICKKYGEAKETKQLMRWVICGLWQIWKSRNSVVFEKILITPIGALELLSQQVREIVNSGGKVVQQHSDRQCLEGEVQVWWVKPLFRTIKVNCDRAWCKQTSMGGCGWVTRDFVGIFQAGDGVGGIICGSSLMAEVEAIRLALMACVELGFELVQLETDSKVLMEMLNGVLAPEAALEGIL